MFRIKVCGVTSPEDAALAVEAGADAVGINFFAESARYVDPQAAAPIVEAVGKSATVVGVFVNESPERIVEICGDLGIRVVQLSGREPADSAARMPSGDQGRARGGRGFPRSVSGLPVQCFSSRRGRPRKIRGDRKGPRLEGSRPHGRRPSCAVRGNRLDRFGPAMASCRGPDAGERGGGDPDGAPLRGGRGFRRRGGTREEGPGKSEIVRGQRMGRVRGCGNRQVNGGPTGRGTSAPSGGGTWRKR